VLVFAEALDELVPVDWAGVVAAGNVDVVVLAAWTAVLAWVLWLLLYTPTAPMMATAIIATKFFLMLL